MSRKVTYELTSLIVSGSGRHVEHGAVVLPVRSYPIPDLKKDVPWRLLKSYLNTYWGEPAEIPQLFEKLSYHEQIGFYFCKNAERW
ncbi:MAG: hypothetical protein IMF11_04395 [Proteobacteria bacterium]|nr:hypothetical protein [Pseudomonadota bacterium]